MIVECGAASGPRLVEPDDLRRFKVRLVSAQAGLADLAGIEISGGDALVPIDLVPRLPGAPVDDEWLAGFRAMVEGAAAHGWVDAERHAIRAHVEQA